MAGFRNFVRKTASQFFEYDTPKIVRIHSIRVGIANLAVQIVVVGYIIGYVLIYEKGYQLVDVGVSGTTTKVKGVAYTNSLDPRVGNRVWDAADVVPSQETGTSFIMTNMIVTSGQAQGECAETGDVRAARCRSDADCLPAGKLFMLGHGVSTGVCNMTTNTCMIRAWCPIEDDRIAVDDGILNSTKDFTVFISSHVYFPYYDKSRTNILQNINKTYLQTCTYDSNSDPFCPIFRLGYIVEKVAGPGLQNYNEIARDGAVIEILISWNCDFDWNAPECRPHYDFHRLDKAEGSLGSPGYNYRYSNNYVEGNVEKRQLIKAYGIIFIITVDAKARAFNVLPTFLNIGNGLALLVLANIVCDFLAFKLLKGHNNSKKYKYKHVRYADAYKEPKHENKSNEKSNRELSSDLSTNSSM